MDPPATGAAVAAPTAPAGGQAEGHPVSHAGFLYGAVVAAATLAVVDDHVDPGSGAGPSGPEVVENLLAVVLTLAIYYAVHVYTRVLGDRTAGESSPRRVWSAMTHESPVLIGGLPGTAVYLLCTVLDPLEAGAWSLRATTVMLGVFTWVLARRAGVRGPLLAVEVVAVALLGVLMIALKTALH